MMSVPIQSAAANEMAEAATKFLESLSADGFAPKVGFPADF